MNRHLLAVVVIVADTALLRAGHPGLPLWAVPAYASLAALVVALSHRAPAAAFVAALALASVTASSYVLLLWAAYQAGSAITSRRGTAALAGAALGGLASQVTIRPAGRTTISALVLTYVVFVALPLLVGRYLERHRRLVSALDEHNRRLRGERESLAERERLRIARDVHDSLGHRLGLVSVQAAALEVSALPSRQRQAVQRLASTARGAMNELHELVGTLRGTGDADAPGAEAIGGLVEEFRAAGMPVTLRGGGEPRRLPAAAGHAAYRVIQEGLTNAAKHAPGLPVTVSVEWEPGALLLTVVNRLTYGPCPAPGAGHGLAGLDERVRLAGGFLDPAERHGRVRAQELHARRADPRGPRGVRRRRLPVPGGDPARTRHGHARGHPAPARGGRTAEGSDRP